METGYLWLFLCFKYWILVFLAPKLFESSMNAHAGFGTLWERGSLKDGPLWKILNPFNPLKSSKNPGIPIQYQAMWATEWFLHHPDHLFRRTMARDKSWYIGWYPEKVILGPMNARNSLTNITLTVDLVPSLMVLLQEPPEETFEDGDDALKVPWMQWTALPDGFVNRLVNLQG